MKFTLTELFGMYTEMPVSNDLWDNPKPCLRCGCSVFKPDQHRKFHHVWETFS